MNYLRIFRRSVGNLYVGSNVKQREQLGENYLEGTKVVAVKGSKNIKLVSKILEDQGATIQEFEFNFHHVREIEKAISTADVLIDGVQMGGSIEESQSQNNNLIVAQCDCDDPFSAMTAVARISMALFERQKNDYQAQRLIASDCLNYWKYLNQLNIRKN
ncbi:unnamed protein product [Caenorhabditis angaria]|uniref:Uncharacterized protein n=1 Tax=Caenorhabditis angaria TaxID=860376 RepID=A0A9P1IEK4_9PELO|nr:unnamed protein product [Caenorhabditis angaria]